MKRSVETIGTIMEWHEQTFPEATLAGQCAKFEEEAVEVMHANTDEERLKELADMFIVACGVFRFDTRIGQDKFAEVYGMAKGGMSLSRHRRHVRLFTPQEVWEAVVEKMKVNRAREWKKTSDGVYKHKEGDSVDNMLDGLAGNARPMFDSERLRELHRELMEHAWHMPNLSGPVSLETFPILGGLIDG